MGGVAGDQILAIPDVGLIGADDYYRAENSPCKLLALNQPIINVNISGHPPLRIAETQWVWTGRGIIQARDLFKKDKIKIAPPMNCFGAALNEDSVPVTQLNRKGQILFIKEFLNNADSSIKNNRIGIKKTKENQKISLMLQNLGIYNRYDYYGNLFISDVESLEMMESLFGETKANLDDATYRIFGWWKQILGIKVEQLKYPIYGINSNKMVSCNGVRTYFSRPDNPRDNL